MDGYKGGYVILGIILYMVYSPFPSIRGKEQRHIEKVREKEI
jgi:hypothetical protein